MQVILPDQLACWLGGPPGKLSPSARAMQAMFLKCHGYRRRAAGLEGACAACAVAGTSWCRDFKCGGGGGGCHVRAVLTRGVPGLQARCTAPSFPQGLNAMVMARHDALDALKRRSTHGSRLTALHVVGAVDPHMFTMTGQPAPAVTTAEHTAFVNFIHKHGISHCEKHVPFSEGAPARVTAPTPAQLEATLVRGAGLGWGRVLGGGIDAGTPWRLGACHVQYFTAWNHRAPCPREGRRLRGSRHLRTVRQGPPCRPAPPGGGGPPAHRRPSAARPA